MDGKIYVSIRQTGKFIIKYGGANSNVRSETKNPQGPGLSLQRLRQFCFCFVLSCSVIDALLNEVNFIFINNNNLLQCSVICKIYKKRF